VPGMILVGGASVAKLLYDRSQDKREARAEGQKAITDQADKGAKE
jgi:hypothetical protein